MKSIRLNINLAVVFSFFLIFILLFSYIIYIFRNIPSLEYLKNLKPSQISFITGSDGEVVDSVGETNRILVSINEIPAFVKFAFISAEDAEFYKHRGINLKGILRALVMDILTGSLKQGGSSITQQLARTLLLSRERTLMRKIKEIYLAYKLEKHFSKDEILELYLNQIYLGQGAYGVEAASRTYFGKSITEVTLPEGALLAGLPKAPSKYSPVQNPQLAKMRQVYVLERMLEEKYISKEEFQKALAEKIRIKRPLKAMECGEKYYTDIAVRKVREILKDELPSQGGYIIQTPMDKEVQCALYNSLREGLVEYSLRSELRYPYLSLPEELIDDFLKFQYEMEMSRPSSEFILLPDGSTKDSEDSRIRNAENIYAGIVEGVEGEKILVRIGEETFSLGKEIYSSMEIDHEKIQRILKNLKRGHIIFLTLKNAENSPPAFQLYQEPYAEGAALVIDNETGEVKGVVGGYSYERSQFNRAIDARRQTGSAFKPFVYTAAIQEGFNPSTPVPDFPLVYKDPDREEVWKPKNYMEEFKGFVPLRTALAQSINSVSVYLTEKIGINKIIYTAKILGIESPLNRDLSTSLGSSSLPLEEMVRSFSVFPNLGVLKTNIFIKKITDMEGNILYRSITSPPEPPGADVEMPDLTPQVISNSNSKYINFKTYKVLDENIAYIMVSLLKCVIKEGTGWRAKVLNFEVGGKTGTTDNQTDAWFIGFSKKYTAGVWVGYDQLETLGEYETGAKAALPIWIRVMRIIHNNRIPEEIEIPPKIVFVKIDRDTGLKTKKDGIFQAYIEGSEPEEYEKEEFDIQDDLLKRDYELR